MNEVTLAETMHMEDGQLVDIFQQIQGEDDTQAGEQYLCFTLGDEYYAVDILCVKEIRAWENATRIPNTPEYINGVINLRGNIVPVIDLRRHFGIEDAEYLPTTVVIVMSVEADNKERQISIVVDTVSDVIRITDDEINPPPGYGDSVKAAFIHGLVTVEVEMREQTETKAKEKGRVTNKQMVMLLDRKMINTMIDCLDAEDE